MPSSLHCISNLFYTQYMTTLQQVTTFTRKFLAIGTMLLLGFLVIYFGVKIGLAIKEKLHPTPPPPPTVTFGKLPDILFPSTTSQPTLNYSLNTITGDLPNFGDRAKVFTMTQVDPNLLALTYAKKSVATVGFSKDPIVVTDTKYAWTNDDPLPKTLTMNIQTHDFTLTSSYMADPTVLQAPNVPDQTTAIQVSKTLLTGLGALPDDLDDSKTKVTLFTIANNNLVSATSLSQAQIVRVDFFQKDVDGHAIYYPQPSYTSMHLLIASTQTQDPQIVGGNFTHQEVGPDNATYPIKTTEEAYKDLQSGNAYIASFDPNNKQVIIRNIALGYYMSDTPQKYLMPIFVFQGDNNFFAYVNAVNPNWIETAK